MSKADTTTVLAPIRYPLTDTSVNTLRHATELASEGADAELLVLHVNLLQQDRRTQRAEIAQAIDPIVGETDAALLLRSAFLVEEAITDEVIQVGADHVVIGQNQRPKWRRVLSRLLGNEPHIGEHLREHTDATIEIVE